MRSSFGLVNTDEQLTLLQFDAFGWPPLALYGLLAVPLLARRWDGWTLTALGGLLTFVVVYIGYFYHGIALGPRYYFEAMPWLLLLAGRGAQVLAHISGSRLAALTVVSVLELNALFFYLPHEFQRRIDYSGMLGAAFGIDHVVEPDPFRVALAAYRLFSDAADDRSFISRNQPRMAPLHDSNVGRSRCSARAGARRHSSSVGDSRSQQLAGGHPGPR